MQCCCSSSPVHRRLGHPNHRILNTILHQFSLPVSRSKTAPICNSCYSNKMHRLPFSENSLQSQGPLQIIYSDLWGPSPVLSIDNNRYYALFVDQFTKYMWLFTIKSKKKKFLMSLKLYIPYLSIDVKPKFRLSALMVVVSFKVYPHIFKATVFNT